MKSKKNLLKLGLCAFLICSMTNVFAQFKNATVSEQNFGVTVNGRGTGNDILDRSGNVWKVSVWEDVGGSSGFGFRYNTGTTTTFTLTYTDASDPDVCLSLDGNGVVHALVAFYSGNQGAYYVVDYTWNGTTFVSNSVNLIDSQTSFGTAINIDCDYNGNFVVVWDVNGAPFARAGTISSGTYAVNAITAIGSVGNSGTYPDVCIYDRNTNVRVTYCYISGNGNLIVDSDSYGSLTSGTSTPTNIISPSPTSGNNFLIPRIGCPGSSIGNYRDWSVVVVETDGTSTWIVKGYNYNFAAGIPLTGPNILNDGFWQSSLTDLKSVENVYPVVAYDNQSNILVGWTLINNGTVFINAATQAIYPIAIRCDYNLDPITNIDYWYVPPSLSSTDVKNILSLSGRHAANTFSCTYYDDFNSNVVTKSVVNSGTLGSLRQSNMNGNLHDDINFLVENSDILINGRIYDVNGKLLYEKYDNYNSFYKGSLEINEK